MTIYHGFQRGMFSKALPFHYGLMQPQKMSMRYEIEFPESFEEVGISDLQYGMILPSSGREWYWGLNPNNYSVHSFGRWDVVCAPRGSLPYMGDLFSRVVLALRDRLDRYRDRKGLYQFELTAHTLIHLLTEFEYWHNGSLDDDTATYETLVKTQAELAVCGYLLGYCPVLYTLVELERVRMTDSRIGTKDWFQAFIMEQRNLYDWAYTFNTAPLNAMITQGEQAFLKAYGKRLG